MDATALLREMDNWPVDERIQFVQVAWDRIAASMPEVPLTDDTMRLLDQRLAAADANPDEVVTWEAIEQHIRRPR